MKAVITGDIINSRLSSAAEWQPILKNILKQYGKEPLHWELFRGDSFQLDLSPGDALLAAIHIKAGIKQLSNLDVRIAIGIGTQDKKSPRITEATGPAFTRSGECFDQLKKQTLAIASPDESFDEIMNMVIIMATLVMDNWSTTVASVILKMIENPEKSQQEIAAQIKKSQSTISEALKRGGFEEVKKMEAFYRKQIDTL
ncbi:MAG: SatD family protein [Ginsengibacter sp.]|jgi:hypothetical protein